MPNDNNFDRIRNLVVGEVVAVSSYSIDVELDLETPNNLAINAGSPRLFPKINGYVIVGTSPDAIVGIITSLNIRNAPFPKRKNYQDFDIVDLPFPVRQIKLRPIGTISKINKKFERGVFNYPTIGDSVYIPTDEQLEIIVSVENEENGVYIGNAPLANNEDIFINPDKLFGRHCAILGNTGSGKSCTVAGLVRWVIEKAIDKSKSINSRFIILDPNGEYKNIFKDLPVKVLQLGINLSKQDNKSVNNIYTPAWLWNSSEWIEIANASDKTQTPVIKDALRKIKFGITSSDDFFIQYLKQLLPLLYEYKNNPSEKLYNWPGTDNSKTVILNARRDLLEFCNANSYIEDLCDEIPESYSKDEIISLSLIINLIEKINSILTEFDISENRTISEDLPIPFNIETFINEIQSSSLEKDLLQHTQPMIHRLENIFNDQRIGKIVKNKSPEISLVNLLNTYLNNNSSAGNSILILDLSLIPSEILNIVVSVIARLIFEALQRYKKIYSQDLPTSIILEEAHTFIKANHLQTEGKSLLCNNIFERISREGRKFGLGLIISSQRPSELSPTILSQCNTFILHRIVNDKDQELVKRLVPDNISALLDELPVLPTRQAILLGWASPIPLLINIRKLHPEQRPNSSDPKFWKVMIGEEKRQIDWEKIVRDWYEEGGLLPDKIDQLLKKNVREDESHNNGF